MIYTTTSTTKNIRSLVGKCFLLVISMLLCGVSVWAADKTVSSAEIYEGDYTVNVGETLRITSTGTFTITGNLINNGGTIIVDGGTLEVGGNVENTSQYKDGEWGSSGNPTTSSASNWTIVSVTEGNITTAEPKANKSNNLSGTQTQTQTGTVSGTRERTKTEKQLLSAVYCEGSVAVKNGGKIDVTGNFSNKAMISIETTDANKISSISVKGNFDNSDVMVSHIQQQRTKTTKETQSSTNKISVTRTRTRNVTRKSTFSKWTPNDDNTGYGDWAESEWSTLKNPQDKWNEASSWISSEPTYSEPISDLKNTVSKTSTATITLDNGYLVVNGDVTLEDKTTINFNQTNTKLKGVVDGEQVAIEPTLLVRGNATIQDDAKIALQSKKAGSLIVAKTFTDNATSDDQYPWSFEYQEGEGENAIKIKVKTDNGFSFLYGKYTGKNFDDTEEIAGVSDVVKDLLEELENLHETEEWFEDNPRYKTRSMEEIIKGLEDSKISVNVLNFLVASLWNAYIEWQINYFEEHPIADYNDFKEQLDAKENELEKIIENFDIDVEAIAKSKIDNEINIVTSLLPITLNYFTAEQDGEEVVFDWQTASEVNNDFFTIEYSLDGIHFSELANEDGNGTTSELNDYTVSVSADGFAGITYFRLKQTDFNGEYSYSDVILLNVENETSLYVYPNPAVDVITIAGSFERISVCDAYSRTLSVQQESTNSFNVSALPVGTYYVVATTKQGKKVLPFVKR